MRQSSLHFEPRQYKKVTGQLHVPVIVAYYMANSVTLMFKFPTICEGSMFIPVFTRAPPMIPILYQINSVHIHPPHFFFFFFFFINPYCLAASGPRSIAWKQFYLQPLSSYLLKSFLSSWPHLSHSPPKSSLVFLCLFFSPSWLPLPVLVFYNPAFLHMAIPPYASFYIVYDWFHPISFRLIRLRHRWSVFWTQAWARDLSFFTTKKVQINPVIPPCFIFNTYRNGGGSNTVGALGWPSTPCNAEVNEGSYNSTPPYSSMAFIDKGGTNVGRHFSQATRIVLSWLLIFVDPQRRTCFMSTIWRLEFWCGFSLLEYLCIPGVEITSTLPSPSTATSLICVFPAALQAESLNGLFSLIILLQAPSVLSYKLSST